MTPRHLPGRSILVPLSLVLVGALAAFAAISPSRPAVVASVDLEKVFNTIDLQKQTEARLEVVRTELEARREKLRTGIEDLQAELDSFQPGSTAQQEVAVRVEEAIAEFRAVENFARLKLEAEQAKAMREIYLTIRTAAGELAAQRGWDYVMIDDTVPAIDPSDANRMLQQISSRRLLFANPSFDVTKELIDHLNARAATQGG